MKSNTSNQLAKLRQLMKNEKYKLDAYLVFSEDAHQSEYIADCDKRRAFVSGFTGSAGFAAITMKEAALWTDGRYYAQADKQLDSFWKLMKSGLPETPSLSEWLSNVLSSNSRVGVDPKLISNSQAGTLNDSLSQKGHALVAIDNNLVDEIWENKPATPQNKVFIHPLKYSGKSHSDKLKFVREQLSKEGAEALVVSALDEIAWLFNLRGSDISFNPVFMSYALVTSKSARLYLDSKKVDEEVRKHLGSEVELRPYEAIFADLQEISNLNHKLWIDPNKSSWAIYNSVNASNVVSKPGPITLAKALKNEAELEGLRQCHIRDAAALVTYLSWLEERINAGDTSLDECSVADKLDSLRAEQKDFVSLSFDTISSSGPNGAIIHYKPEKETCAKVTKDQLYLVDCGGQYKDGTTDVTRTLHFAEPTAHQKRCFTRVLQGVIAIDALIFPRGTTGREMDILARQALWSEGLDYRHGTGHGVGAFLNVHEGPQSISFRDPLFKVPFEPGMTTSDEPGYYEDGAFGIRIENVLVCKEVKTPFNFGDKGYLGFEHLTLVPIQTKMIDTSLLSKKEIEWINNYHKECLEKVGPLLSGSALEYLKRETRPLALN